MNNTIFFAWQLDTPSDLNKDFIWRALQDAAANLLDHAQPELSPRPEKDTEGISGNPNIVETIFRRISECSIFVADVTFVAETAKGKKTPNPNVLLELGYATRCISWDRTILVMNSTAGGGADLPFDMVQHRWPIEYKLTEYTQVRDKRYFSLTEALTVALKACEEYILTRAKDMFLALDTATFALVALFEKVSVIPIRLPAKTMGQTLTSLQENLAFRRLVDLGALRVISEPELGYGWTADGLRMIKEINSAQPKLLPMLRAHAASP